MSGLIAGFDAGQTHTRCRLALIDAHGCWQVLAEGEGGGVTHLAAPGGEKRFCEALRASLRTALNGADTAASGLVAAAVGASGIEHGTAVQDLAQTLAARALALPTHHLVVTGDERTALRGALGERPGVLLISGTGCIAVGQDGSGRQHRCGGWGWLLDGAGSALDIGRDGLAASVQMADGRLSDTVLRPLLWEALGASAPQDVKAAVVAPGFGPAGFASLAPVVAMAAAQGDREAVRILQRSARALATMALTVSGALGLEKPLICPVGGAMDHLPELREGLGQALNTLCPEAVVEAPQTDACSGALAMAAELITG
ncbi:MAG: BadF/BadG/BcrA/BcrD ATPase family protein [Cyanobacteriota bacterium]|jgi:glucosamine kinase|nr:BadF/BadG/BcrA/BcrD ATPase family protein [Cyanobacteriota bacterium]